MTDTVEQIWQAYHANLLGFILSRVNDPAVAEDILQDVFLKIQSSIGALKDKDRLKNWIYRITRNQIIDHYRARKTSVPISEELAAPEIDDGDGARQDIENCLLPMIAQLPDKYRRAVRLSEIDGLTQKQVSDRLNISLSGAKSRVQRGRAMVKDLLTDCCQFAYDHRGSMVDYEAKGAGCDKC